MCIVIMSCGESCLSLHHKWQDCTDIDDVLFQINQRLRKLEKSDSEKNEEIGSLNRIIEQKDVVIHGLKMELVSTKSELAEDKEHIKELGEDDGDDDAMPSYLGKPEKNSSNSSIPLSQENIAAHELRRTKSLRKSSGRPSDGQLGHEGHPLTTIAEPDRIIRHELAYCKCSGHPLDNVEYSKIRKTQVIDLKFVVETSRRSACVGAEQLRCSYLPYQVRRQHPCACNISQCRPVHPLQADCRTHLRLVRPEDKLGNVPNILKENSAKSDRAYEEIRRRIECDPVVGAYETGASVGKELHWNWIFQNDLLTYVYQMKSRGLQAIDSKFPNGLPNTTLVTDRYQSYFKMNVRDHQVCLAHLLRNAEYLNELDTG